MVAAGFIVQQAIFSAIYVVMLVLFAIQWLITRKVSRFGDKFVAEEKEPPIAAINVGTHARGQSERQLAPLELPVDEHPRQSAEEYAQGRPKESDDKDELQVQARDFESGGDGGGVVAMKPIMLSNTTVSDLRDSSSASLAIADPVPSPGIASPSAGADRDSAPVSSSPRSSVPRLSAFARKGSGRRLVSDGQAVSIGAVQRLYHSAGVIICTLQCCRMVDPFGALDIYSDGWLSLFSFNSSAVLMISMAFTVVIHTQLLFRILNRRMSSSMRRWALAASIVLELIAIALPIAILLTKPYVKIWASFVLCAVLFTAICAILVIPKVHELRQIIRTNTQQLSQVYKDDNGGVSGSVLGLKRAIDGLRRLEVLGGLGALATIGSGLAFAISGLMDDETVLERPDGDDFSTHKWSDTSFLVIQTLFSFIMLTYAWVPMRVLCAKPSEDTLSRRLRNQNKRRSATSSGARV